MTVYRTCRNCALERKPCLRRDELTVSMRGLGLTSVKFSCTARQPLYHVGQRVNTTWPVSGDYEEYGRRDITEETWPATIVGEHGPRFIAVVDDVPSDYETPAKEYFNSASLYVKAPAHRISPLDEPARAVCPTCQSAAQADGTIAPGWCADGHSPFGCALAKSPTHTDPRPC